MNIAIPVHIVAYDPVWPERATEHAARLDVIRPPLLVVHHIGSTAVPGLAGKPVIDLMPIVSHIEAIDEKKGELEALGYRWHGEFGVEGRRFCTLTNDYGERIVQLHIYQTGSRDARRQLAFRNYLRAFPDVANAYALEKRRARDLFPNNSTDYAAEKGAFIRATEAKALAWFVG